MGVSVDERKVDLFFRLLRTVYGVAKFQQQWPTELDLQAAEVMWGEQISKHEPEELRSAIENAQRMSIRGESEWQWPNVGLILSGAKRHMNASHREYLSLPEPETEKERKRQIGIAAIAELKQKLLNKGVPHD